MREPTSRPRSAPRAVRPTRLLTPLLALGLLLGLAPGAAAQSDALHRAVAIALETGDLAEVQRILSGGADVNARSGSGMTPIMHAAFAARPKLVALLLERGADPDAADDGGTFVLQHALMAEDRPEERTEIVRLLLEAGADPRRLPGQGEPTIALAEALGFAAAAALLRAAGPAAPAAPRPAQAAASGPVRWRSVHPVQVIGWRASGHTCALSSTDELYCWGLVTPDDQEPHRLGIMPERIGGGQRFGAFHAGVLACGVRPQGAAYCWQNLGAVVPEVDLAATRRANEYVYRPLDRTRGPEEDDRVAPGLRLATVATGWASTAVAACGLDAAGRAYCWGPGAAGQIGDGRVREWEGEPQPVAGGLAFRSVGVGVSHACGLGDDGVAYCWGANDLGQIGQGTASDECSDPAAADAFLDWVELAARSQGRSVQVDAELRAGFGRVPCRPLPAPVADGRLRFTSLAVGAHHACGVGSDGAAYCWGGDHYGQLGAAERAPRCDTWPGGAAAVAALAISCSPSPVRVALPRPVRQVAAGELHSCALTTEGSVYCWGTMARSAPARRPPWPSCVGMFDGIAGPESTNQFLCRIGPELVESEVAFETIVAGAAHACGLTARGEAYCWGFNGYGQLGDGSREDSNRAVRVRPPR